jgi:hypothetical protein
MATVKKTMNPGTRDRLVHCGKLAVEALGLDSDHDSPNEVREAIERLQGIVDKLPKTMDGVLVMPGMTLWWDDFGVPRVMEVVSLDDLSSSWPATIRKGNDSRGQGTTYRWHVQSCYSTREANPEWR